MPKHENPGSLSRIADELEQLVKAGGMGRPSGGSGNCFELAAAEGPYEEVIICRSYGTAKVFIRNKTDLYIVPNGKLHRLNCEYVGDYVGVFKSSLTDDLLKFPDIPDEPFDQPSPIDDFRMKLHPTKAKWEFHDGTIYGVGPANSYIVPIKDGSNQLKISIAMVLTGGTGRYKGARGTISSLGATWFPFVPGGSLQDSLKDGAVFSARGVHGFRITFAEDQP
jgi:hypothetical protein